jgi:hypothetical protein
MMVPTEAYEPPADLDVAAALAAWLRDRSLDLESAVAANPLIGRCHGPEIEVVQLLSWIQAALSALEMRALDQLVELIDHHDATDDEPMDEFHERMDDLDQRRLTMLELVLSMASPLRLGPPDSLMSELVDVVELPHG